MVNSPALAHRRANLTPGHGGDRRKAPRAQLWFADHHERPLIYLTNSAEDLQENTATRLVWEHDITETMRNAPSRVLDKGGH